MPDQEIDNSLNERQKEFCRQYLKTMFNGTQAAILAGYSEKTARQMASELLTKPAIEAEIKGLLVAAKMTKEQAEKLVSDMAHSSLNDYMKPVTRYEYKTLKILIPEYIQLIQNEIEDEEEYRFRVDLDKEESEELDKQQAARRRKIAKLEIEYERNPTAIKTVQGPLEEITEMELDLVKLAADKEKGRIKSWKMGKYGVEVELYGADGALRDILKIHGSYAPEKQEHTGANGTPLVPDLTKLTDAELRKLSEIRRSVTGTGQA